MEQCTWYARAPPRESRRMEALRSEIISSVEGLRDEDSLRQVLAFTQGLRGAALAASSVSYVAPVLSRAPISKNGKKRKHHEDSFLASPDASSNSGTGTKRKEVDKPCATGVLPGTTEAPTTAKVGGRPARKRFPGFKSSLVFLWWLFLWQTPRCGLVHLPKDLTVGATFFLALKDALRFSQTSKRFYHLIHDPRYVSHRCNRHCLLIPHRWSSRAAIHGSYACGRHEEPSDLS